MKVGKVFVGGEKIDRGEFYELLEAYAKWQRGEDDPRWEDFIEKYSYSVFEGIYYSLLELPSGGHVPLPKILEWGPEYVKKLRKVPISRKVRDCNFYPSGFFDEYDWSEETKIEFWAKETVAKKLLDEGKYRKLRIILADDPSVCDEEEEEEWLWETDRRRR